MASMQKSLWQIRKLKKEERHPLIHKVHKKHNISKKTLFYIKEYGEHTHVAKTIIKESIKILILASLISSIGGLALEEIKKIFISIIPLIILLPALNDMVGDYGTIVSSKISTMLYEKKIHSKWWKNQEIKKLFLQIIIISFITAIMSSTVALVLTYLSPYGLSPILAIKTFIIVILDIFFLVAIVFIVAVKAGMHYFRKKEDPNNFLIPITTSIADFGNMIVLTILILIMF